MPAACASTWCSRKTAPTISRWWKSWKDQASDDAHEIAAHTKQFRDALGPLTGALYDQRWYTAL